MKFRVLDIETIPDESVWTQGDPSYKVVPALAKGCSRCSPTSAGFSRGPAYAELVDPFPPPQAHRVVALAYVDVELDVAKSPRYGCGEVRTACAWDAGRDPVKEKVCEAALLGAFSASVDQLAASGGVTLVTWNGRGFDLPVISMRSLKLGVPCRWYYADRDVRYRYSQEGHLDLMDFLSDYGAARNMKLGDVARLVGLPGKTGSVTGASVHGAYLETTARAEDREFCERRRGEVARYCLQDAVQTALVFLRTRFHLGKIDRDEYHACLETFERDPAVRAAIDVDWGAVRLP
jgi:hypothetical protein